MNGYFQRLMARSAGGGAGIHPLSRLPRAGLREAAPPGGGELADAPRPWERPQTAGRAGRHVAAAEPAASPPEAPAAKLRGPASRMSNATTVDEPAAATSPPVLPPLVRAGASEEKIASTRYPPSAMPAAQTAEPDQPPPARAAEWFADEAPEAFRLMAPAPPGLAHTAGPSGPSPPVSPEVGAGRVQAANLALQARPGMRPQKSEQARTEAAEVHVSIGRIEITAVQAPTSVKRKPVPGRKPLSLDDYLAQRGRA